MYRFFSNYIFSTWSKPAFKAGRFTDYSWWISNNMTSFLLKIQISYRCSYSIKVTLKLSPPGQGEVRQESRKSAWGVKEKCVRGQGEVHRGSRRSASAECLVFSWSISPWPLTHFSLTPGALVLDPWRTSPWPLTHFSVTPDALHLDLEGLFLGLKKSKKNWNKNPKLFLKTPYILKYSYALVVKSYFSTWESFLIKYCIALFSESLTNKLA